MEEGINSEDLQGSVVRQSFIRQGSTMKSTLSGKSTPRNASSLRRLHSSRTPRRDGRSIGGGLQWFRSNRLVYWLLLITLWAYLGFYVQSRWAHGNNKDEFLGFGNKPSKNYDADQNQQQDPIADENSMLVKNMTNKQQAEDGKFDVVLAKKGKSDTSHRSLISRKKSKRARRSSRGKVRGKQKVTQESASNDIEEQEIDIPKKNTSYGMLVGPFGSIEDEILEWSPEKRSGTCDRKGAFARLVWSRKFVLVFHELSMTGAPLSMLELATEFLSCGATVSAVVLSKKGGLMSELARRRIKVLEDKEGLSFKTAMKADLVIAGSAVCALWIDQYITKFPAGASQLVWWIMENRREYFDRTKPVLNRVKMLVFLSESQSKQWLTWCDEENIKLRSPPSLVPLSVNDELAFVAGISCSLNSPSFSTEKLLEKRRLLRDSVRKEMGLKDNDMLVMSLSSINPGKGQFLLLESARLMFEQEPMHTDSRFKYLGVLGQDQHALAGRKRSRALLQNLKDVDLSSNRVRISNESTVELNRQKRNILQLPNEQETASFDGNRSKILSDNDGMHEPALKVLIGSVGSKSNKIPYVKGILGFLAQHSNLSKSVLWTPATTHVASLYSAADVYVINSQGVGETFGRVTIEAMAFGLPVLGTDAGGTKEIVDHNITGMLHPLGRPGTSVLAKNFQFLLKNPSERQRMGIEGRQKVERMYLKRHMFKKLAEVLIKCMRIK